MSWNSNNPVDEKSNNSHEQPTLWEHYVLHKAFEKKLMLFDLEIGNKKFKANKSPKKKRTMSAGALDAAITRLAMTERQRANSAPGNTLNATATATDMNTDMNENPPQAFRCIHLDPNQSFSTQTTSQSTSFANSFDSVTLDSDHNINFGTNELLALSPETFRDEAERQAALIKARPSEGLTMKRRFMAEEGLPVLDEQLMMSGALSAGDVRCEVCAAKERAMAGLGEAGIVAL
jgi:hypothetical protein